MSRLDQVALIEISMGKTSQDFQRLAKDYRKAMWGLFFIGAFTWDFFGWQWSLIPFVWGVSYILSSLYSTNIGVRIKKLENNRG